MNTHKKDILMFISDQHAGFCSGYAGDRVVRTPHLDRIAQDGTVFDAAYTRPIRSAFLPECPCSPDSFRQKPASWRMPGRVL